MIVRRKPTIEGLLQRLSRQTIAAPATPLAPGGAGAVSSVFGRTGAVAAEAGDYSVGQVTGAASEAYVNAGIAALEALLAAVGVGAAVHGEEAGAERPAGFLIIIWIGAAEPENAIENDLWVSF